VKCHSNLLKANLLSVWTASKKADQLEGSEAEASIEAVAEAGSGAAKEAASTVDLEKCTRQLVLNVVRHVKCHSNLQQESQFYAENATLIREHLNKDTDITNLT
jgi:hypothetical protein